MLCPRQMTGRFGTSTSARRNTVGKSLCRQSHVLIATEYILETALPQVGIWLSERTGLSQQGNDMLAFFYDEKAEKFESRPLTRLEPLRRS